MNAKLKNNQKVGLKEIAEAAKVSMVTVSSVLNGRGRISQARREEILELARKMGYQPSVAARILKSKNNHDIGLLIFENREMIRHHAGFIDLLSQFMKQCRDQKIRFQTEWFDPENYPEELPSLFVDGLVGGLIIAGNPYGASAEYLRNRLDMPFVRLGEPGEYSVNFNIYDPMKKVVSELVRHGAKRIALCNGSEKLSIFREIKAAFVAGLASASMGFDHDLYFMDTEDVNFRRRVQYIVERAIGSQADTLLCVNGLLTKGVVAGLLERAVKIPRDLQIVCVESVDWETANAYPAISALDHDFSQITANGIKMLRTLMAGKSVIDRQILLEQQINWRDTTNFNRNITGEAK